jgi:hypothetical protein
MLDMPWVRDINSSKCLRRKMSAIGDFQRRVRIEQALFSLGRSRLIFSRIS